MLRLCKTKERGDLSLSDPLTGKNFLTFKKIYRSEKNHEYNSIQQRFCRPNHARKGKCLEIFCFRFFPETSSSKPLRILRSFQIFSKIHGDICKSRCTASINDIGGKFATGTAGVVDTSGEFVPGVNEWDIQELREN